MNEIPSYEIEEINLIDYNDETRNIILSNLKNYTKLKKFECSYCGLTELPELPKTLIKLYCWKNNLMKLPKLPDSLKYLDCSYNNLTELPDLPHLLIELHCDDNNLTELPKLPNSLINSLIDLGFGNNNLTKIPDLSKFISLNYLFVPNNNLTELSDLPISLTELICFNNNLTYSNFEIKTINETNSKNRIIKRMQLLNRTLLLEQSAVITMNPKRIERLLDNNEINFFDGSFDTLTS